jgi:hypothetical protein
VAFALVNTRRTLPKDISLEQAFGILEGSLKRYYPNLKEGYTWQEAISNLKSARPAIGGVDWIDLENTLKRYEAFRYGGVNYEDIDPGLVVRLAQKLKKREKIVS